MALAKKSPQQQTRRPAPQIPHTRVFMVNGALVEQQITIWFESGRTWHPGCDKPPYALLSTRTADIEAYKALVIKLAKEPRKPVTQQIHPAFELVDHASSPAADEDDLVMVITPEPVRVISKPAINPFARRVA